MIKTTYEKQYRYSAINAVSGQVVDFFEDPLDKLIYANENMVAVRIKEYRQTADSLIDKQYQFFVAAKNMSLFRSRYNIQPCMVCHDKVNCTETAKGFVCPKCAVIYRFECAECHEIDYGSFNSHKKYCTDCKTRLGILGCDICSATLTKRTAYVFKKGVFCREHKSDYEFEKPNPKIHYMSVKPGKIVKNHRLVGTEIELENGTLKNNLWMPNGCGVVTDGSLGSGGREFITAPAASAKLEKIINTTCENLAAQGFTAERTCGLHIHVDMRDFKLDPYFAYKLVKTYIAAEEALYQMLPSSRRGNHYCGSIAKRVSESRLHPSMTLDDFITNYYNYSDPEYIKRNRWGEKYTDARYCGLNMHSLYYRGTVEIRYHEGTNNPEQILNWIQLHLTLIEWAMYSFNEVELAKIKDASVEKQLGILLKVVGATKANTEYALKRQELFNPTTAIGRVRTRMERAVSSIEVPF